MPTTRTPPRDVLAVAVWGYAFFLALDAISVGMKLSFSGPLQAFLAEHASEFTELRSFVIGILGTALAQSSSAVTSMTVVLTQEGVMPMLIAAGIVHGANLGTSVTSSLVAFASDVPRAAGGPLRRLWAMLTWPRGEGFRQAVGAAVVHDAFNIIMVTAILLFLELPFGWVLSLAEWSASALVGAEAGSTEAWALAAWLSPTAWTRPVTELAVGACRAAGAPTALVALAGLMLLFVALKGFSGTMKAAILAGLASDDVRGVGDRLLGRSPIDTFVRGALLTMLVQSSSATTSLVVPLAALGLFEVRRVFPFILGANVGTTFTALLAAMSGMGEPGFREGLTIALCHLYLNVAAVALSVVVPGLSGSILGAAELLAAWAERRPWVLLAYLWVLCVLAPAAVYALPQLVAAVLMAGVLLTLLVGPQGVARRRLERELRAAQDAA